MATLGNVVHLWRGQRRSSGPTAALLWAAATGSLSGCDLTLRQDIHDPDPAAKIPALVDAARQPTAEELAALVEALEHDDAAVRLFAIESLKRATGETRGFRAYESHDGRAASTRAWQEWLAEEQADQDRRGPVRTAERDEAIPVGGEATDGGGR